MTGYKHIEHCCGVYIASNYKSPVEIGIGNNTDAAIVIHEAGYLIRATDIRACTPPSWLSFIRDDIFAPNLDFYTGTDVLYSVRPAEEMVPPMNDLARTLNCDLVVYHLGFEGYGDGGEVVQCGVPLHIYHRKR